MRTGQLIDVLAGHTSTISSVSFSANSGQLTSASWDNTVKVWDVFGKAGLIETLEHSAEVLQAAFLPGTGDILATTLSGQMYVWDIESSSIRTILECAADIKGGRLRDDRNSSKNSTKNKYFNSVCVSPCGKYVLGGGNSKNVCVYDLGSRVLIRRFALTQNRQLDGVLTKLNSKNIKDGVVDHEIDSDLSEDAYELRNKADLTLPGAKRQNNAAVVKRNTKLAIRIKMCKFSPDGSQFACATTEGLVIYSLAKDLCFAPFELSEEVTIDNIVAQIKAENYLTALLLALRMNDAQVLDSVFKCVPI